MIIFPGFWQWAFIGGVIGFAAFIISFIFLFIIDPYFNIVLFFYGVIAAVFSGSSSIILSVVLYGKVYEFLSKELSSSSSEYASLLISIFAFIFLGFLIFFTIMCLLVAIISLFKKV